MEPLTKQQLNSKNAQNIVTIYQEVERQLPGIYRNVTQASTSTSSYTFTFNMRNVMSSQTERSADIFLTRILERLKVLFPDSDIEYIETKSAINGNVIERAVKIDWS